MFAPAAPVPYIVCMAKGLFRDGDHAQVSYDSKASIPITREQYRDQGHQPPFDDLPTREEYERDHA